MSNDFTGNARAPGEVSSRRRPLSSLCRDIGLASVATELNVQLDTLEPDIADAIERGAAALLLARFSTSLTWRRRSVRAGEQGGRHKLPGLARKARRSRRFLTGKSLIAKHLGESMEGRI